MSQNINVVLMHHFIQSTAPPYKNGLIQKFEGRELKIYRREKHVKKTSVFRGICDENWSYLRQNWMSKQ